MNDTAVKFVLVFLISVFVRWTVSINSYSGAKTPPMFGDYEAQRHWMEITYHLPVSTWYTNSSANDLLYWGLDYPPLTAYHSWLCGAIAHRFNASWVALGESLGYESEHHKLFMRYTVLVADLLLYFPFVLVYFMQEKRIKTSYEKICCVTFVLLYPGLILIDHGHFQYNCICLGLTLWAVIALMKGRNLQGSVAFVLALNYKQIALYFAVPFFCYLLGDSMKKGLFTGILKVIKLGVVVLSTFLLCWLPFLADVSTALQVLHRLFPFARGLYEDKVANVWCSISVLIKLKEMFTTEHLIKLCLVSTLVALVPSALHLLLTPSIKCFKVALVNSSLVFFLFSFHVHEKSILFPALAVCLLLVESPSAVVWFLLISTFSILPLLLKDRLLLPCIATTGLFLMLSSVTLRVLTPKVRSKETVPALVKASHCMFGLSMLGCMCLSTCLLAVSPPRRLPDLWPVLIALYSCGHLVVFLFYFHWLQYTVGRTNVITPSPNVKSKHIRSQRGKSKMQ